MISKFPNRKFKGIRWMPRFQKAMKDVVGDETLRGGAEQPSIRRSLNEETQSIHSIISTFLVEKRTQGSETSQYLEEKKTMPRKRRDFPSSGERKGNSPNRIITMCMIIIIVRSVMIRGCKMEASF